MAGDQRNDYLLSSVRDSRASIPPIGAENRCTPCSELSQGTVCGISETATPIQRSRGTLHVDWKRRTESYNIGRRERRVDDAYVCVCVRARKTITVKPFGPILTQPAIAIMDRRVGITRCRARILRSCLCLDSCTRVHATNVRAIVCWTPREFPEVRSRSFDPEFRSNSSEPNFSETRKISTVFKCSFIVAKFRNLARQPPSSRVASGAACFLAVERGSLEIYPAWMLEGLQRNDEKGCLTPANGILVLTRAVKLLFRSREFDAFGGNLFAREMQGWTVDCGHRRCYWLPVLQGWSDSVILPTSLCLGNNPMDFASYKFTWISSTVQHLHFHLCKV